METNKNIKTHVEERGKTENIGESKIFRGEKEEKGERRSERRREKKSTWKTTENRRNEGVNETK